MARIANLTEKKFTQKSALENESLQICLTLYSLACHICFTFSQNFNFNFRRDHQKKSHMSVAIMSWYEKRAYIRICPEKRRKKSGSKGLIYRQKKV